MKKANIISIEKFSNDMIMSELIWCSGSTKCVLNKLDELDLYDCDFTLEEIGIVLNITRERVRQIESSAIKKLKHPKMGRNLINYIKS